MSNEADRIAFEKFLNVRPAWSGIQKADDVLDLPDKTVLHAGPPFASVEKIPAPVLNSTAVACVFEGWSANLDDATAEILSGKIAFLPAQDYQVVTPMAAVVTPSMMLIEITDLNDPDFQTWTPINGGGTGGDPVPRYGRKSEAALDFLRLLNGDIAMAFAKLVEEPMAWFPIMDAALTEGDDGHLCHVAAHKILLREFAKSSNYAGLTDDARSFFESWPFIHLNFWMACAKLCVSAMSGTEGSSLITHIAGNGNDFGIKVAGLPSKWFTAPASKPVGKIREPFTAETTLGALGDSAITEGFGTGAMALSYTGQMQELHNGFYEDSDFSLPDQLLMGQHPAFEKSALKCGLSAEKIAVSQTVPIIELGSIDRHGIDGGLGAGIFRPPLGVFEQAVNALKSE